MFSLEQWLMSAAISERHDNMAGYIGCNNRKFFEIYGDQVETIQRKLVDYIKLLQPSTTNQLISSNIPRPRPDLDISTKDGYPWMPPVGDDIEQKKDELENLLRRYLNDQYSK
jgi:hypothetical protein